MEPSICKQRRDFKKVCTQQWPELGLNSAVVANKMNSIACFAFLLRKFLTMNQRSHSLNVTALPDVTIPLALPKLICLCAYYQTHVIKGSSPSAHNIHSCVKGHRTSRISSTPLSGGHDPSN